MITTLHTPLAMGFQGYEVRPLLPAWLTHPPTESDSPGGLQGGLWRRKQEELKTLKCSLPVIVAPSVHN